MGQRQAKAIGWEGDSRVGPSPPSEWPAPPHSLHQPPFHGKRLANFICWLLLRGLCRQLRLLAVFAARPVPATSSAGCLLQRPCHAMPCLPTFAMIHAYCPRSFCPVLFCIPPPVHYHVRQDHRARCRDCPDGSCNTGLHRRSVHRLFVHCAHLKGGGLGLRVSSLASCYDFCFSHRVHRSWAMV